jgi:hypothetical protein
MKENFTYSFTGAAMTQQITAILLCNADLGTSDDGSSKGSSEKIPVLVDGVALNGSEDNLLDKLLLYSQ